MLSDLWLDPQTLQIRVEVLQLLGQHLQPLVLKRAALPACQHELLQGEMLLEPTMGLRLREIAGQPVLDVVAVGLQRQPGAPQQKGHQEHHHRDDGKTAAVEKRLIHALTGQTGGDVEGQDRRPSGPHTQTM